MKYAIKYTSEDGNASYLCGPVSADHHWHKTITPEALFDSVSNAMRFFGLFIQKRVGRGSVGFRYERYSVVEAVEPAPVVTYTEGRTI